MAVRRERVAKVIVDSSALIAIARAEADAHRYTEAIEATARPSISAANLLEASIVADRTSNPVTSRIFDQIVRDSGLIVEPVTAEHARIAREAYRDFGKGSGHPAGLNFGDCFAYALAKDRNEALLYKGDDFSHTDVRSALAE
jgi:ribonuclease VapC